MPLDKTDSPTARRRVETANMPQEVPSAQLLKEVEAWGRVARESHENCEKGAQAQEELNRRRNRSGQ